MNATDCARATEPYSTTARPKARLKLASRRRTCCGWAASANIGPSSPVRIIRTSFAAAVRIVTCGAPATARKLKSNALPRPAPGSDSLGDTVFGSALSRRQRGGVKQSRLDVVVVPTSVESYGALWTPGERWGSGLTKERTDGILIGCGRHPGNGRARASHPATSPAQRQSSGCCHPCAGHDKERCPAVAAQ